METIKNLFTFSNSIRLNIKRSDLNKEDFQKLLEIYQSIKNEKFKESTKEYEELLSEYLLTFPDMNKKLEEKINKIYKSKRYKSVDNNLEKFLLILEDIEEAEMLPKLYNLVKNENVSFPQDEEEYSIRNIQFVNKS